MDIVFDDKDYFVWQTKISYTNGVNLKVIDNVEGNINISIHQKKDEEDTSGYTRYNVIDPHNAEVIIANADLSRYTSTNKPILLGTFKNDYLLYMEYVLEPVLSNAQSVLRLKFSIKRK